MPQLLARQVKGGSYQYLENSLLQSAAPMRRIDGAMVAAGLACALLAILLARAERCVAAAAADGAPQGGLG